MAFIGKNTIENLTTAMYEDLRIIYREYIQNSADSIDHAIECGLITEDEAIINIEIDKKKKYVCVSDNGMGMSADFKETIFDPFTRAESSVTNKIQGTGLGMAITRNLVEAMGGTIDLESELGQGSCYVC